MFLNNTRLQEGDYGKDAAVPIRNRNAGDSGIRLDAEASGKSAPDQGATDFQPPGGQGGTAQSANCRRDEASRRRSGLLWHAPPSASAAPERSAERVSSPACSIPSKKESKERQTKKDYANRPRGPAS